VTKQGWRDLGAFRHLSALISSPIGAVVESYTNWEKFTV
jgi:hypothetical protein